MRGIRRGPLRRSPLGRGRLVAHGDPDQRPSEWPAHPPGNPASRPPGRQSGDSHAPARPSPLAAREPPSPRVAPRARRSVGRDRHGCPPALTALSRLTRRRGRAGRPRSRAARPAGPCRRGEHHGDAAVAVVVVGHREAVGAGGRHGQQVADPRRRPARSRRSSTSPLSQWRPTMVTGSPPAACTRPAIAASKRWPYSATSRLSPIPPSTATNVRAPRLTVTRDTASPPPRRPCCGRAR